MEERNKVDSQKTVEEVSMDFGEICRFCLCQTKSSITINDKCLSENSAELEKDSIFTFMTKLRFIKMENSNSFPSQVCENCCSLIKLCYNFSQICQKSDTLLRDCYENIIKETNEKLNHKINKSEFNKLLFNKQNAQGVYLLDCNTRLLLLKKLNAFDEANKYIKAKQTESDGILETYKQKLSILSGRIKEVQSKLAKTSLKSVTSLRNEHSTYACSQCSLKFKNSKSLNFHFVIAHGQKRFRFECKKCKKSFIDQKRLDRHYKLIHKICESEFPEKYSNNKVKQSIKAEEQNLISFHCVPFKKVQSVCCLKKEEIPWNDVNESKPPTVFTSNHPVPKQKQFQNLTDFSAFLDVLDSFVDSLTIVDQEQGSSFKVLCKNCNPPTEFGSTLDFIHHMHNHQDESEFFKNWANESETKKGVVWNCSECPASYIRKQSLYCHLKAKHKQTNLSRIKCPEIDCSESFTTNRQLIRHGISVHQKYFAYFHEVFKKVLQPTSGDNKKIKNFECDVCQRKYIYKTSLRKHILAAHLGKSGKDNVVCSYCGKTLSSKLNLKSHIEFVHEALFVSCPICKKKINFKTIGKHYKTHKTNSDVVYSKNSFLCNLCGKLLKSKRSFEDHQKLHKNVRDELCDICGRGFTTKKFLRLHKKTHEGVQRKVFGCDQCDKVFSGRHTLNRHLLTHSGEKNFICEICSKCFYTLQELNRHVRYHKKEYRFTCELCDMRFLDKSRFRHHMMKHRNIRPHKCQFCEKMFIVRGKMHLHMAAKHNVEVQDTKGIWKDPKTYVPLDDLL